ncbi:MAG: hypothetical protein AAGB10_08685 [Pseudomonadota bacterium]
MTRVHAAQQYWAVHGTPSRGSLFQPISRHCQSDGRFYADVTVIRRGHVHKIVYNT